MGRRTLVGHELQFHEKYTRNPERYEPSNLLGRNLMDIFLEWCNSVEKSTLLSTDTNIWLAINDIYSVSPQIALLKLAIGKWGEDGVLLESEGGQEITKIAESQVPTAETRAALLVPPQGYTAFLFSEGSNRGCGGAKLLPKFAHYWSRASDSITMERDRVIESDAILAAARVTGVEVRSRVCSSDLADFGSPAFASISHAARVGRKGKGLPFDFFRRLEKTPALAAKYVGIREDDFDPQSHEVLVTLKAEGKTKKFDLNDEDGGFFYNEVLNSNGEPILSDNEFVVRCVEKADERLREAGLSWSWNWNN